MSWYQRLELIYIYLMSFFKKKVQEEQEIPPGYIKDDAFLYIGLNEDMIIDFDGKPEHLFEIFSYLAGDVITEKYKESIKEIYGEDSNEYAGICSIHNRLTLVRNEKIIKQLKELMINLENKEVIKPSQVMNIGAVNDQQDGNLG